MGTTSPLQIGELVAGKYRLEREIGAGGMGVVYSAIHIHLEQRVALKFLTSEATQHPEIVERFWREAKAAVKIQSEHVARVIDIGELDAAAPYIVMEYLEGDDLDTIVKRDGPLPVAGAIRYVLQACEALAEVHAQGMVHRDIKPANLFLSSRPDGSRIVKLLDFGISKAAPEWADDGLTNTAAVIGSPRYMSPEQLRSARDVDARSDIWGVGITLFELLAGASPFARGSLPEVCASILKDPPQSLVELRPEAPPELEAVIHRCLAKTAADRYRNVAELAMALRPFGDRGVVDISIERIVGIIQISKLEVKEPSVSQIGKREVREPSVSQVVKNDDAAAATAWETPTVSKRTDEVFEKHYLDRIGPRRQIPRVVLDGEQIRTLSLDHRAGFMLSLVDGRCAVDELLDISGMPRLEALRILCELLDHGVLSLTPPLD